MESSLIKKYKREQVKGDVFLNTMETVVAILVTTAVIILMFSELNEMLFN